MCRGIDNTALATQVEELVRNSYLLLLLISRASCQVAVLALKMPAAACGVMQLVLITGRLLQFQTKHVLANRLLVARYAQFTLLLEVPWFLCNKLLFQKELCCTSTGACKHLALTWGAYHAR
jgi:hypothetical protein